MNPYNTTSPVIFCIFNRPETTQRVFNEIAKTKPPALYVVADAARPQVQGEAGLCKECRAIAGQVDWPCEVTLDYAEDNMGCKQRIYSGISNAFKQFEFAIILEDDCLPSSDFFRFVDTMRDRYQDDQQVMQIAGTAFIRPLEPKQAYYRSAYATIWGWATWKRAWGHFDLTMPSWPEIRMDLEQNAPATSKHLSRYLRYIDQAYTGRLNTWDYQFIVHVLKNKGHCITPMYNLISNIGFGANGTHTQNTHNVHASTPHDSLPQNIIFDHNRALDLKKSTIQIDNSLYRRNSIQKRLSAIAKWLSIPYSPKPHRPKN